MLRTLRIAALCAIAFAAPALGQGFIIGPKTQVQTPSLAPQGNPPVGTGCTIANGSTDMAGSCTASAASGSIAFANTYAAAPNCVVADASATPIMVYTVTASQITLTTITSTHIVRWVCLPQAGF